MLDKLFYFISIFLMLTGLIAIIYFVILKLLTPRKKQPYVMLIPLTQNNNPVSLIGSAIEKRNICGETPYCEIIAVDLGMSAETRAFISSMYSSSDKFTLCNYSDMQHEIKNKLFTHGIQLKKAKKN